MGTPNPQNPSPSASLIKTEETHKTQKGALATPNQQLKEISR
jgi:hypothetical protein